MFHAKDIVFRFSFLIFSLELPHEEIIMSNIIELTDFSAPELDPYARLTEAQLLHFYEPDYGLFIAESPKVIERAINAGYEPLSLLV